MSNGLLVFLTWLFASVATVGSLFFSEVMSYPPCTLCWYQRICMYPLVMILLPSVISFDRSVIKYAFPITIVGLLVAVYHNFVYFGIIDESLSPCSMGVSCKAKFIQWFGFVDIPQLSLFAFVLIFLLLFKLKGQLNEK